MGARLGTWNLCHRVRVHSHSLCTCAFHNLIHHQTKHLSRYSSRDWKTNAIGRSPAALSTSVVKFLKSCSKSVNAEEMETLDSLANADVKEETSISEPVSGPSEFIEPSANMDGAGAKPLSKKALKRMARAQKHKEYRKQKRAENLILTQRNDAGYSLEDLDQSSYYFENGLRKVYPYNYVFATHAKGRWVGRTIQNVLEREFGFDQPGDLTRAFDSGMIHVNNKRATSDYILRDNDYISHRTHRHENPVTSAPIEVIENNNDVVVINKPSSIPCHPCGRYRFNSVVFILGKEMGLTNLRNIYRLDRLTSGVLILGKSVERTKLLMDQVANRQVQKEYVCRVVGKFPDGTVKVDQPLQALSNKLRLQVVSPKGKASQTTFTRISYNGKSSVVRCVPHTGRTHQIRVHLQYLGHPIINDAFYNNEAWGPNKGKSGIYEVPHDKVCERILSEHHVTLWDGGENPLYDQKLKEMAAEKTHPNCSANSTKPSHENPGSGSCLSSDSDMACNNRDNTVCSTITTDEPPQKRHKADEGFTDVFSETDNKGSVSYENSSHKFEDRTCSVSVNSQVGGHPGKCSDAYETESESLKTQMDSTKRDLQSRSCDEKLECLDQRPGFEMFKWSVDLACELCKKRPVDPEEKHLVMFLHAIKYKGPGWEYRTAMPDWAKEDWSREEHYAVESLSCFDL